MVKNVHEQAGAATHNAELLVVLANPHRDASIIPSRPARGGGAVGAAQAAVAGQ